MNLASHATQMKDDNQKLIKKNLVRNDLAHFTIQIDPDAATPPIEITADCQRWDRAASQKSSVLLVEWTQIRPQKEIKAILPTYNENR